MIDQDPLGRFIDRGLEISGRDGNVHFRAVPNALDAEAREYLKKQKPEILALLGNDTIGPATHQQVRMWFLEKLAPECALYNVPLVSEINGPLEPTKLSDALRSVIVEHAALRTTFELVGRILVRRVRPEIDLSKVLFCDEAGDLAPDKIVALQRWAATPFDLENDPLVRSYLVRRDQRTWLWLLVIHHLAIDGWSIGLVADAISKAMQEVSIPSPQRDDAHTDYGDYALKLRNELSEKLKNNRAWWREQLAGTVPLSLPTDRARPATRAYQGHLEKRRLDADIVRSLQRSALSHGATLGSACLAAYAAALARISGQRDLVIGVPAVNRQEARFEGVVGNFISVLPIRLDTSSRSFGDFVAYTHRQVSDATDHSEFSLDQLVADLDVARDPARDPLFQTLFVMQARWDRFEFPDLTIRPIDLDMGVARFDLEVHAIPTVDNELELAVIADAQLFDETTVALLADQLVAALTEVAKTFDQDVASLPLTPPHLRDAIAEWNATDVASPSWTLPRRVTDMADTRPKAVAVKDAGTELTYTELRDLMRTVALQLSSHGLTPGDICAVHMTRTHRLVPVLLGIMAAGAVYLPLDPEYPANRLAKMVDRAQPRLLITDVAPSFEFRPGKVVQAADILTGEKADSSVEKIGVQVRSDQGAYLIFTSGSTGEPKGVPVTHSALANLLASMAEEPGLSADDRFLAVTSPSFDIAALELFLPLVCGATVIVATLDEARDPTTLAACLARTNATAMQATPATWQGLIRADWPGKSDLIAWCGGEALPRSLAADLLSRTKAVWNLYGPTETTIWSALARYKGGEVTIDRPIANTRLYVLDERGRECPVGAIGELAIAGVGLSDGYFLRPDLTAERFSQIELRDGIRERVYLTGDVARQRHDLRISFLGRSDHQVKIRGYRIELGEIEAALVKVGANEAIVVADRRSVDDVRLAAFVRLGASGDPESLRTKVAEELPTHMVPGSITPVDAFPMTANRKIDRVVVGQLACAQLDSRQASTRPHTPIEDAVIAVWRDVLGYEDIDVGTSFFAVGGHSLLAVTVVAKLEARYSIRLPLVELFRSPTVGGLAGVVRQTLVTTLATAADDPEVLRSRLDRLEDAEVEELLSAPLSEPAEVAEITANSHDATSRTLAARAPQLST